MGTNYYWYHKPPCPECLHQEPGIHIGKSSAGWCFSLRIYPYDGVANLNHWLERFSCRESFIKDEYGEVIPQELMRDIITKRLDFRGRWTDEELASNHAVRGPGSLVRHVIDGFCVGHGKGTWDLFIGEFS